MPSPFPGMDPYIEKPTVWSDFHGDLAAEIRADLNRQFQPRYVAQMVPYVTYEIVEVSERRGIRPDVGVWQPQPPRGRVSEAVMVATPAPIESRVALEAPLELYTVEIHEVETMQLVTSIEILSPVNKRRGHEAYEHYRRKRRELLRSAAHLVEIDLLRAGDRPPLEKPVPPAPYYVTLSRVNRRPKVVVWPIQLWDKLPILPVPLLEPDPDVTLDLGSVVALVYERGAYARLIDYPSPPPPPELSEAESKWVDEHLHAQKAR
ncbi:MAG: hypothetical protein A2Z03_03445 [Chloroflexi bacterium RBG_16_56_8]|nr:MAG: hypothetical protein A2Z03_03445 [Chloroflexi bacterium RBG_16_56_8]